ncbi:MAG: hypothetical protein J0M16_02235 [Gammaproteobacteria bacterium]|jgi:hypothetical protein|nr:hypothetical protein [Gammaproteobacteria bacterium]
MSRPVTALLLALLATGAVAGDDADRQAELDRRCEAARDEALAPIRADIYKECLADKRGDDAYCRRYADGYNGERIGGSPRFYELPECQAAFEFRNRDRRPGSTP